MKVAPVSADLLIKIGLVVGVLGLAWYAYQRATGAAGEVASAVGNAIHAATDATITAVNPANPDNLANQAATSAGAYLTGDKDFTVGGWFYDKFHGDPLKTAGTSSGGTPVVQGNINGTSLGIP